MSRHDVPHSNRRIDELVEGLRSLLSEKEREQIGARLATDLVDAAKNALTRLERMEEQMAPSDPEWSEEVGALQDALAEAEVER